MNILVTAVVALVTSLVGFVGAYNYIPLDWISTAQAPKLGSTITTIQGSDTLSASRTVINTNFSNLNTDKLQSGSTAAALTITSGTVGTLSLTNALTVANGGTGSTTLSSNQVLLGNGTGILKTVSGWGTSGQLLTSGGAGAAPTWTTVTTDPTADYNFTGTAFRVKNLHASSTAANPLTLNTVAYAFPSAQGTASSTLMNDGSGNLKWSPTPGLFYVNTSPGSPSVNASTTIFTTTVPANALISNHGVKFTVYFSAYKLSNTNRSNFDFSYANASTTAVVSNPTAAPIGLSDGMSGKAEFFIFANSASNSQRTIVNVVAGMGVPVSATSTLITGNTKTTSIDATQAQPVTFIFLSDNGVISFTPSLVTGEYIR